VAPRHQTGSRDIGAAIDRGPNRAFLHGGLGTPHLLEDCGAVFDVQPIQQLLPRHRGQLHREDFVFRRDRGFVGNLSRSAKANWFADMPKNGAISAGFGRSLLVYRRPIGEDAVLCSRL